MLWHKYIYVLISTPDSSLSMFYHKSAQDNCPYQILHAFHIIASFITLAAAAI